MFSVNPIVLPRALGYLVFLWAGFMIFCLTLSHFKLELFPFKSAILRLGIIKSHFSFFLSICLVFLFIFINLNNADALMNHLKMTMSISHTLILHSPSIIWKMIMKKTRNPLLNC